MSSNLSTVIQSITNTSRLVRTLLPVIRPCIMGNLPKISKWRTNGDPGISGPWLEARPAVLGNRGKM